MMKRKMCLLLTALLMLSSLSACGDNKNASEGTVELLTPVGVAEEYATVTRENLINYKVYGGKVVPEISEVVFSTNQNFLEYGSLPGTDVKDGDVLLYASTEKIDKEIEALKEQMDKDLESFNEYVTDANKAIAEAEASVEINGQIVQNFENMTEAEKDTYGRDTIAWQYPQYESLYKNSVAAKERNEQELKKRTELYDLDSQYNKKYLNTLNNKKRDVLATADSDGTVVAIGYYDNGDYIQKDTPVAAVGNLNELRIVTETIYKSEIKKAVSLYTVVNGKKYATTYLDTTGSTSTGEVVGSYSTFVIDDPNKEVKVGDFALVVLVSEEKDDVLCVPTEAIKKEEDASYVYLHEGDTNSLVEVKTGIKSGVYTEIISGLSEGDKVVSDFSVAEKKNTMKLTYGTTSNEFKGKGYLFYSSQNVINNSIEYGTTYVDEVLVKNYQRVAKGDVIAKIHVKADNITIARNERSLLRANEDLASLVKDNENDKNAKAIKAKKEYIEELQKTITKMKQDAATTEIKAPYNGIITYVAWVESGEIWQHDSVIAVISAEENCFVVVEDENGQLTYGNEATITYEPAEGGKAEAHGEVVTVSPMVLSQELKTGYTLLKVSSEDIAKMAGANRGSDGWWMRSSFSVTATVRNMDNVILIPKRAVTTENGVTYVTVLDENNKPKYKSFIAGGSDKENYWVVDGLTEGTEICLE